MSGPRVPCPATGKRTYFQERLANRAITEAAKRGELPTLRHYQCPDCGYWHLSRKHRSPRRGDEMDQRMMKIEGLTPTPQTAIIPPSELGWPLPERILAAVMDNAVGVVDAADPDAVEALQLIYPDARFCLRVTMSQLPEQSLDSPVNRGAHYVAEGSIPVHLEIGEPGVLDDE